MMPLIWRSFDVVVSDMNVTSMISRIVSSSRLGVSGTFILWCFGMWHDDDGAGDEGHLGSHTQRNTIRCKHTNTQSAHCLPKFAQLAMQTRSSEMNVCNRVAVCLDEAYCGCLKTSRVTDELALGRHSNVRVLGSVRKFRFTTRTLAPIGGTGIWGPTSSGTSGRVIRKSEPLRLIYCDRICHA